MGLVLTISNKRCIRWINTKLHYLGDRSRELMEAVEKNRKKPGIIQS